MESLAELSVIEVEDPAHEVAVEQIQREISGRLLLFNRAEVKHNVLAKVGADDAFGRDADHGFIHSVGVTECGLHVDEILAVEELPTTVFGRDHTVTAQRLGE